LGEVHQGAEEQEKVLSLNQNTGVRNEIAKHCTMIPFNQLEKDLNIKYELLSRKQLDYIKEFGCKILVLDACSHYHSTQVCIEESNGQVSTLTPKELQACLTPKK